MNIFEITIQKRKEGSWPIETKLTRSYDSLPVHHKGELKLSKQDFNELTSLKIQSQQYGQFLGRALFQGEIYQAYLQALDSSWDGIRVLLIVEDKELEVLYWHWLCAPQEWNFISLNQRCCFSISLKTPTERVFPPINQNDLKALILAASPQGLEEYSLASFNVQETVDSLKIALGQIPTDVLAVDGGLGMPTLDELCDRLTQTSYSLLHIVGHGQVQRGETFLYWATKENLVWPVEGSKLIERLQNIQNLPHFIFLSACETAKSEAGMALGGLAQRMVRELGIPAVLAMTENVTIETAALLSKAFYPRLRKHGEVDKALVEATSTLSRDDILVPALFSRLGRNSLFDINRNELSAIQIRQRTLHKKSPYKGLKRFNFQDREYFFGRDALIYKLFTAVNKSSFSLVLGASGSGKSSVVRAGLIPEIKEYIEIYKKFYYFIFTPDRDPFESLYRCLKNEEKDYNFSISEAEIALKAKSGTLMEVINTLKKEDEYWFLFIDQFEQLFTICTDLEKRKNFIAGIVELAKKRESSVKIVLAMRSDFLEQFSFYPTLGAIANQNNIHLVTEMYPDELRRAIAQPAAKNGVVFEEGLIEQIIEEVERQKGYLPLLQYTLDLLWEKECKSIGADGCPHIEDRTLNKINYAALEGVRGALQKRVDEIYKDICEKNPEGELVTKQIFLKLVNIVEIDSESKFVSRRAYRNEFVGEPIESILKRFIDENLLVSSYEYSKAEKLLVGSRDDKYIEHATVEIAHEILLSSWEELKRWLEGEKEAIILKNWLAGETRKWLEVRAKDELKASDELLKGSRLEQVVELRQNNGFEKLGGLVAEENEFIDGSVEWRDRQIREKEEQRQREQEALRRAKEAAEKLVAEQTQRAEEQTRFAEKLKKEKNQALITQSLFLVDLARQEINTGNATNAILLALEALPRTIGNSDARPYISEAEVKLYEAISNLREHIVLLGHQSRVTYAAFSPNGLHLVTTSGSHSLFEDSKDHTARLWDINTGKQITVFEGHQDEVNQAVFSPNGQYLVTASSDNTARLWDVNTGNQVAVFKGHEYAVYGTKFSPNGQYVITSSGGEKPYNSHISDGTVRLWDVNTGEQLTVFRGHGYGLSTDGKLLVTTSNDRKAYLWNIKTGKQLTTFRGHEDVVEHAVFSPDGRFVVTGSKDKTARLWDIKTGKQLTVFRGHESEIAQLSFSPDGQYLLTVARDFLGEPKDKTARLWDSNTGQQTAVFRGHEGRVIHATFSSDGQFVVTAGSDRTARLWNVNTGEQVAVLAGHEGPLYHAEFSPDAQCILTTSDDNTARLWKIDIPTHLAMFSGHEDRLYHAEFSPDGKRILTAAGIGTYPEYDEYYWPSDKTARLWDANTGKELMVLRGHDALVNHAAFSPNGQYVVTASDDTTARLWDVKTGQELILLTGHNTEVVHAEFSPDSKYVATASRYGSVCLWKVESGELAAVLNGNKYVAFSPDGRKLVTTSSEMAYLWDANTGQQLTILEGHKYVVYYAEFSPDGKYVVTASGGIRPTGFPAISDRSARLWDVETGRELAVLEYPEDLVIHAGFSPDGKHIVTTGVRSARLWDVQTSQQVMVLTGHNGWVRHFAFSPNGKHLVTVSGDGTACLWNINIGKQIAVLADHTSGVNHAAFSSDGQKLLLAYADGTAHLYRIFLSTQDLIDYARAIVPRELTSEQRKQFFLPNKSIL